jgi:hypothetical protein
VSALQNSGADSHSTAPEQVNLTEHIRGTFSNLAKIAASGRSGRYRLTALKRHSQSVRPQEVKTRLANHDKLSQRYGRLDPLIGLLGWDQKSVRVYAQAVIKSDVRDLRRPTLRIGACI